jgi:penicillin-binding protein 2
MKALLSPGIRFLILTLLFALVADSSHAATKRRRSSKRHTASSARSRTATRAPAKAASASKPAARRPASGTAAVRKAVATRPRAAVAGAPVIRGGPWTEPTYLDSTVGDNVDGEDLEVRRAAVEALGPYNGSVVVVDPATGRILTMVNQRLALGAGFQPCSTIKVSVALAALNEKIIKPEDTKVRLGGSRIDLTYALARSNNLYFATLGQKLGFERVSRYAHQFGYGENAGLGIAGETTGTFPAGAPRNGGVGMLTSFGEDIRQTPLQLAALMSAIANGGTLYWLQYPRTPEELRRFAPRVKRQLDVAAYFPAVRPGLQGAVNFGTARRAQQAEQIAGKTGTCTDSKTHLGWFGSFNDVAGKKLAVVVLLTGGRPAIGPAAAGIAGDVYRRLGERNYFASVRLTGGALLPASLISTQACCR